MSSPTLKELFVVIDRLVGPDGCPWDKAQTPESLADYLVEESHEVVSAIRSGNVEDVCEELGDVAFLLLFVSSLYEKQGKFSFDDVLNVNRQKMIRRHPHVFGDTVSSSLGEQLKTWEQIKRAEHADGDGRSQGIFVGLPDALPPLIKAYRIHSKAACAGFTWEDDDDVVQQVEVEWLEWLDAMTHGDDEACKCEFGDLLFSLVELGRRKGIKANEVLDIATRKFLRRFVRMEALAVEQGRDFVSLSFDEKDALWNTAKAEEASSD
ncbi:MAG: nucleoside triphosphate pyrophosphohydrolase [Desulfovibrio sp.]|jgi:ATP diphosphatase|nr:nucleoside triphosphate pyrophosphohydrolase [Desulfovibrio sp.]